MESCSEALPGLLNFTSNAVEIPCALSNNNVITKVQPKVWWSCLEKASVVDSSLCNIAGKVLYMPSSSASLERFFSNFGTIQTNLRKRLGIQKAAKLVVCYRILRSPQELDWGNVTACVQMIM
ncbi:hypothetical protein DPMN_084011 [Dreissena polymorpha]|uniref:HAT C-terminal dimerisation domain-containing protein n=1 Tax=Dreissena polymorpha TaxID=45954 RepID=A0A9D3YDM0_DREPO|nr:hypothetical protein DPMN_084011 [Dreissena polymorpha]